MYEGPEKLTKFDIEYHRGIDGRYYSETGIQLGQMDTFYSFANWADSYRFEMVLKELEDLKNKKKEALLYRDKHGSFPEGTDIKKLDIKIEDVEKEYMSLLPNQSLEKSSNNEKETNAILILGFGILTTFGVYSFWDKITAFAAKTADTVLQIGIAAGTNAALFIGAYKASELAINKITGKDHEKVNTAVAGAVTLGANIAAYKHMREEHIHTATGLLKDIWNHGAHFAHTIGEIGLWGAFTVATYAVGHEVSDYVQDRVAGKSSGLVNKISGVAAFAAAALGMYHITHADVPPAPARQPVEYSAPLQPVPAPTAP